MPQGQEPVQAGFVAGDPFFEKVILLMHFDGADMGTVFMQNQITPIDITRNEPLSPNGYPATSTAQKLFGTASLRVTDNADNLYSDDGSYWDFGTGDFTVECAWYTGGKDNNHGILDMRSGASGTGPLFETTDGGAGTLRWRLDENTIASTTAISNNTWHRMAMSRVSGVVFCYLDGSLVASVTEPKDLSSNRLTIGTYVDRRNSVSYGWNGYIDEVRITKGVGRYAGPSYALATEPFPNY